MTVLEKNKIALLEKELAEWRSVGEWGKEIYEQLISEKTDLSDVDCVRELIQSSS